MANDGFQSPWAEPRVSKRDRLMGKLFGRDRKESNADEQTGNNLNDFLRGPSDTLKVGHAGPPTLAKLDISAATRYPQAAPLNPNQSQQSINSTGSGNRPRTPRRKKPGQMIRFVEGFPEIIGEGGDDCDTPVIEISKRRRSTSAPVPPQQQPLNPPPLPRGYSVGARPDDSFAPGQLRRAPTGLAGPSQAETDAASTGPSATAAVAAATEHDSSQIGWKPPVIPRKPLLPSQRHDENRRSFIEMHQAEMREAEGRAFAQAARSASQASNQEWEESTHVPSRDRGLQPPSPPSPAGSRPPRSPDGDRTPRLGGTDLQQSPVSVNSFVTSLALTQTQSGQSPARAANYQQRAPSREPDSPTRPPVQKRPTNTSVHDVVVASGDDELEIFVSRVRHMFELFRLQAETVRPLSACDIQDLARAALWWFLKGRMALELAIRDRPTSPQSQRHNEMVKQQAYADLAKGYWLCEEIIPEVVSEGKRPDFPESSEVRKSLVSNLRKLSISMKRNGFLPPEELFLPQQIDKIIWVEYPKLAQDLVPLLSGTGTSVLSQQKIAANSDILETLPLADTSQSFAYLRVPVDAYLTEQDGTGEQLCFSCLLTVMRPQRQPNLVFVIGSQNGVIQLRLQNSKSVGPVWDDVRWVSDSNTMEIKLPRGLMLSVRCSQADFRMLWSIYDFNGKVQMTLYPRKDENVEFRATLKSFQYFDNDPQARAFPKEPVAGCEVAFFERIVREGAATGRRNFHRGYRIAVVTGPRTRSLSGVNHAYLPQYPVQFGFLRGENNDPALLVKFDDGRRKGSMVLTFNDEKERLRLHSLLIGTALHHDESVVAEIPLESLEITTQLADKEGIACLKRLPWQQIRIINDEASGERPPTVLSEKLRIAIEFKNGTLVDRVNVAPGELKIRLDVHDLTAIQILRQPQQDMTVAVSEAQVPRELPRDLTEALAVLKGSATVRRFQFKSLANLHEFQYCLTGHKVIFDGVACTFAISRRRSVVPIYKKWEAGATRVQLVQEDKQIQLVAFFSDFSHGQCMSFVLKGTDVFEAMNRAGKPGLKIVDAKFPLPQTGEDGSGRTPDEMAFVCLDLAELPGEHDDIFILFDTDEGKWTRNDTLGKHTAANKRGQNGTTSLRIYLQQSAVQTDSRDCDRNRCMSVWKTTTGRRPAN